jgi:GTPase
LSPSGGTHGPPGSCGRGGPLPDVDDDRAEGAGSFRSGFVAILGRPNVGKSTLVNQLVGRKVSIVSDHPQTTRRRITGVVTLPACQIVLLDLPGFQRPFDSLTRRMQAAVDDALREVDAALVMLNAVEPFGGGDRYVLEAVAAAGVPGVVVLNKVDLLDGRRLETRLEEARTLAGGVPVHAVSALRGDGLPDVLALVAAAMPLGPRYFPDGQSSDQPLELLVAELVREQALRRTRDEVPHAIAVEVSDIRERDDRPLVEVDAVLIVESDSQRGILVGKGGHVVKAIGSAARREIETVFGVQVFLDLRVKVRRRWRRDERYVERLL